MGPVAHMVIYIGMTVLRWLFFLTAGLLMLLIIVQNLRGDDGASPLPLLAIVVGMVVCGWICGAIAVRLMPRK